MVTAKTNYVTFGRIVVQKHDETNGIRISKLIRAAEEIATKGEYCKFLVTPGGFLKNVELLKDWGGGSGWNSKISDSKSLFDLGNRVMDVVFKEEILLILNRAAEYLTMGLDLFNHDSGIHDLHAELVCLIDLKNGCRYWTGKSYPTPAQQTKLIQVCDLNSHFITLPEGDKLCMIGCHDLNLFSHRTQTNQKQGGARHAILLKFHEQMEFFNPTLLIQHPHSTDTANIWSTGWSGLENDFPNVKEWVSGIAYCRPGNERPRQPLETVLRRTIRGTSIVKCLGDVGNENYTF